MSHDIPEWLTAEPLLPRGKDDLDYDRGFLDGWEHAIAVLQFEGKPTPDDTAAVKHKRRKVNACTSFADYMQDIEARSGSGVCRSEQSHAWQLYREGVSVETAARELEFRRRSVDV